MTESSSEEVDDGLIVLPLEYIRAGKDTVPTQNLNSARSVDNFWASPMRHVYTFKEVTPGNPNNSKCPFLKVIWNENLQNENGHGPDFCRGLTRVPCDEEFDSDDACVAHGLQHHYDVVVRRVEVCKEGSKYPSIVSEHLPPGAYPIFQRTSIKAEKSTVPRTYEDRLILKCRTCCRYIDLFMVDQRNNVAYVAGHLPISAHLIKGMLCELLFMNRETNCYNYLENGKLKPPEDRDVKGKIRALIFETAGNFLQHNCEENLHHGGNKGRSKNYPLKSLNLGAYNYCSKCVTKFPCNMDLRNHYRLPHEGVRSREDLHDQLYASPDRIPRHPDEGYANTVEKRPCNYFFGSLQYSQYQHEKDRNPKTNLSVSKVTAVRAKSGDLAEWPILLDFGVLRERMRYLGHSRWNLASNASRIIPKRLRENNWRAIEKAEKEAAAESGEPAPKHTGKGNKKTDKPDNQNNDHPDGSVPKKLTRAGAKSPLSQNVLSSSPSRVDLGEGTSTCGFTHLTQVAANVEDAEATLVAEDVTDAEATRVVTDVEDAEATRVTQVIEDVASAESGEPAPKHTGKGNKKIAKTANRNNDPPGGSVPKKRTRASAKLSPSQNVPPSSPSRVDLGKETSTSGVTHLTQIIEDVVSAECEEPAFKCTGKGNKKIAKPANQNNDPPDGSVLKKRTRASAKLSPSTRVTRVFADVASDQNGPSKPVTKRAKEQKRTEPEARKDDHLDRSAPKKRTRASAKLSLSQNVPPSSPSRVDLGKETSTSGVTHLIQIIEDVVSAECEEPAFKCTGKGNKKIAKPANQNNDPPDGSVLKKRTRASAKLSLSQNVPPSSPSRVDLSKETSTSGVTHLTQVIEDVVSAESEEPPQKSTKLLDAESGATDKHKKVVKKKTKSEKNKKRDKRDPKLPPTPTPYRNNGGNTHRRNVHTRTRK